jgi:trigger factor
VEKKDIKVDEKDIDRMISYIIEKHQKTTEVDRPAKDGDQITMDFWGEDSEKKEIEGIRTTNHQVVIGSKVLIPGFEDNLKEMKKGDAKDFTLKFPEKYHAENLQNADVTFHVTVTKVEEVETPELTDDFVSKELGAKTVKEFKEQVEESMAVQEETMEKQRRERHLLDEIAKATVVELAPELLEEETRSMIEEFLQQLQQQGVSLEQWMEQTKKTAEDLKKEMEEQSEKRLRLRLGMQQLVEEKEITVSDEEMTEIVESFLSRATPEQRKEVEPAYQKGAQAYEQLKWQTKVDKMLQEMLA